MELTVFQQILEQFTKANKILIALPSDLTADNTASALALSLFLKKMNKEVDVVSSGVIPENLSFLPEVNSIKSQPQNGKSFVITLNTQNAPLDEMSYETESGKLKIFIKPKTGQYTGEDVTFSADHAHYQAIVIIDSASMEDLGTLFENHADVFFAAPKINIDNKPTNEYFGAINYVDINATSIAEMLSEVFAAYEQQLIDEDIATCLLTGIITKTNSFQHVQTTPSAFMKASQLIELGGRQQEVVKYLYKTKPLSLLRLWGRALARLKIADNAPVIYSLLSRGDFEKAESGEDDLLPALKEMTNNVSAYKIIGLLLENNSGGVHVLLAAHPQVSRDMLEESFNVSVSQPAYPLGSYIPFEFTLEHATLTQAEEQFSNTVKDLFKEQAQ